MRNKLLMKKMQEECQHITLKFLKCLLEVESWGETRVDESLPAASKGGESREVESWVGESAADSTKNGESREVESWVGEWQVGVSRVDESGVAESRGNSSHGGEFPSEVVEVAPPNIERREEREMFGNSGEGFADSRIEAILNMGKGAAGRLADARRRKVTDIKKALALNDKFLLMRAFFNNEPMRFTAELDRLNRAGSLAAAEQLLFHEILPGRKWDADSEADNTLLTVLYRRYCD